MHGRHRGRSHSIFKMIFKRTAPTTGLSDVDDPSHARQAGLDLRRHAHAAACRQLAGSTAAATATAGVAWLTRPARSGPRVWRCPEPTPPPHRHPPTHLGRAPRVFHLDIDAAVLEEPARQVAVPCGSQPARGAAVGARAAQGPHGTMHTRRAGPSLLSLPLTSWWSEPAPRPQ